MLHILQPDRSLLFYLHIEQQELQSVVCYFTTFSESSYNFLWNMKHNLQLHSVGSITHMKVTKQVQIVM